MEISIATLRAAGLTEAQVLRVVELAERERKAQARDLSRIRQRNHRSRNDVTRDKRDIANGHEITRQNQSSRNDVTRDSVTNGHSFFLTSSLESPLTESQHSKNGVSGRARRGSRLSPDWNPDFEDLAFARNFLDPSRIASEAARFRDYWLARAGPQAVKLDWPATWRNWIRRVTEQRQSPAGREPFNGIA
jgi:hypothetical protein